MKNTKIFTLTLLMFLALFNTSCKKDIENNEPSQQVEESALVRSVVTSFRNSGTNDNQTSDTQTQNAIGSYMCFELNYPISVIYNDGSTVSMANDSEFAVAINSQTNDHYIINFVYPFDITLSDGTVQTIQDDAAFEAAINDCQILNDNMPSITAIYCFDFVYPITLVYNNGDTLVVNDANEYDDAIYNSTGNLYVESIEYPFDIIVDGQTQTITNAIEFQIAEDQCNGDYVQCANLPPTDLFNGCVSLDYPVTLVYNDGSTLVVNSDQEYNDALQNSNANLYVVDFQYDFSVIQNGNTITVHNIGEFYNILMECYMNTDFTDLLCFTFVYPITIIMPDGSHVEVHNNMELNVLIGPNTINPHNVQYEYPFDVIKDGVTITIHDSGEYEDLLDSCN